MQLTFDRGLLLRRAISVLSTSRLTHLNIFRSGLEVRIALVLFFWLLLGREFRLGVLMTIVNRLPRSVFLQQSHLGIAYLTLTLASAQSLDLPRFLLRMQALTLLQDLVPYTRV